jgi:2-dehydro-3-deoxyphosphooctonate aldolase (KDO 8-P synthase)
MLDLEHLKNKFFVMAGPNVIETEEHCLYMARTLKEIFSKYDVNFIFKVSFDKANRTSASSYRGVSFEEGCRILRRVRDEVHVPIITDIHEGWQVEEIGKIVDIIQVPAFLCRQTDLLKAVAETGCIIQVKKGQFCSADVMHKSKDKLIAFGNPNVILCERGNFFGYQDLVVDPRNLIWLRSDQNLVSMDITHCLQSPAQKQADGTIKAGGHRDLIPHMGKMAIAMGVDGIFMEVHDRPDESLCDAPTQWYLDKLEWLLEFIGVSKITEFKSVCSLASDKTN